MGTTGSSAEAAMNVELPDILARVREYARVPLAVGFGVATRDHFNTVAGAGADGVVIGSRIISVIRDAPSGQIPQKVREYCAQISAKGQTPTHQTPAAQSNGQATQANGPSQDQATSHNAAELNVLPDRFGEFGGQFVPEALVDCLSELEAAHKSAMADPEFWKEFKGLYGYMNRPSKFYYSERLTEHMGGAKIWLKREDLSVPNLFICIYFLSNQTLGTTLARIRSTMPLDRLGVISIFLLLTY